MTRTVDDQLQEKKNILLASYEAMANAAIALDPKSAKMWLDEADAAWQHILRLVEIKIADKGGEKVAAT